MNLTKYYERVYERDLTDLQTRLKLYLNWQHGLMQTAN